MTNNIEIYSTVALVECQHTKLAHLSNLLREKNIKFTFDAVTKELINAEIIEVPGSHTL